jgi:glutaredoxin 3
VKEGHVAVRIYVKTGCPYSLGAKRLLDEKGIAYEEVNVTDHPERRGEMEQRSGGAKTLPQIFFGDRHVGGYTELQELDRTSGLRGAADDAGAPA